MVGAVHWKMLADLLGLADGTAHSWHKLNGGDRASYVASSLRATPAPTEPDWFSGQSEPFWLFCRLVVR